MTTVANPPPVCRLPPKGHPHYPRPDAIAQAIGAGALLAGAIRYALGAVAGLQAPELALGTPCAGWDVASLLCHLDRSMRDIESALRTGRLPAADGEPGSDPVEALRDGAAALIWTWYATAAPGPVSIGGLPLPRRVLADTAAVEIAVHGWDLYVARGLGREIPAGLAATLVAVAWPLVVSRDALFASPVAVPPCASPGDKLVAYLGRDPGARHHRPGRHTLGYRRVA